MFPFLKTEKEKEKLTSVSQLDFSLFPCVGMTLGVPKESIICVHSPAKKNLLSFTVLQLILRKEYILSMVQYNIEYFILYTVLYCFVLYTVLYCFVYYLCYHILIRFPQAYTGDLLLSPAPHQALHTNQCF